MKRQIEKQGKEENRVEKQSKWKQDDRDEREPKKKTNKEFVRSTKEERGEQKKKWSAKQRQSQRDKEKAVLRRSGRSGRDFLSLSSAAFPCLPSLPSPLCLIFSLCSMLIIVAEERKLNDDKEGWRGCDYDCRLVRAAACRLEEKFKGRMWVKER